MHRSVRIFAALAILGLASPALADQHMHASAAKATTLTGEIVDTGCYMAHEAHGEKHVSCATKCINNGMPMGLLMSDGTLYLLTMSHDNADPYNSMKKMAGKTVKVTGETMARGGMKAIQVDAVQLAAAK